MKLSSLFALHRPISINPSASYPPATSNKTFNTIFSPPRQSKISNEIFTMAPQGQAQSAYQNEDADGLHFSVLQSSSSNAAPSDRLINLDEVPSLEQMARQYRPFHRPPPPVPMGDEFQNKDTQTAATETRADSKTSGVDKERTYSTTITIKEGTAADGQKTYTASASPIIEHRRGNAHSRSTEVQSAPSRQPFLARMHARSAATDRSRQERVKAFNQTWETRTQDGVGEEDSEDLSKEMLLISVKRQRKLKMKKHKYKKLMRRTRNLRRREGRL